MTENKKQHAPASSCLLQGTQPDPMSARGSPGKLQESVLGESTMGDEQWEGAQGRQGHGQYVTAERVRVTLAPWVGRVISHEAWKETQRIWTLIPM